jgi:hypothetical protein
MDYQRYFKGIYGKREVSSDFRLLTSDFRLYYMPIAISSLISSLGPYLPLADTSGQIWESRDDIRADMGIGM